MSGLGSNIRLPRTLPLGAGEGETQNIKTHWDTAGAVERELESKGLVPYTQPVETCPELTAEVLTSPDSRKYTETYVKLLSWYNYSSELLAQVRVQVIQYENMQSILDAQTRKVAKAQSEAAGGKKPAEAELQQRLLLNPEYLEVTRDLQRFQQAKICLDAKVEGLERSLRLISRQVEIRRMDLEQTRTGAAMPARGRFEGEHPPVPQNRFGGAGT